MRERCGVDRSLSARPPAERVAAGVQRAFGVSRSPLAPHEAHRLGATETDKATPCRNAGVAWKIGPKRGRRVAAGRRAERTGRRTGPGVRRRNGRLPRRGLLYLLGCALLLGGLQRGLLRLLLRVLRFGHRIFHCRTGPGGNARLDARRARTPVRGTPRSRRRSDLHVGTLCSGLARSANYFIAAGANRRAGGGGGVDRIREVDMDLQRRKAEITPPRTNGGRRGETGRGSRIGSGICRGMHGGNPQFARAGGVDGRGVRRESGRGQSSVSNTWIPKMERAFRRGRGPRGRDGVRGARPEATPQSGAGRAASDGRKIKRTRKRKILSRPAGRRKQAACDSPRARGG